MKKNSYNALLMFLNISKLVDSIKIVSYVFILYLENYHVNLLKTYNIRTIFCLKNFQNQANFNISSEPNLKHHLFLFFWFGVSVQFPMDLD